MADAAKTLVIFAVFLVLVIGNFRNIKRHRKEKKDAKRKKEIGGFTVMRQMKPDGEDHPETSEETE